MAEVSICTDFGAPSKNKVCHCFHCFPIYLPWNLMPWSSFFECWVLSPIFTLLFHFHKRLFSSSLLSAIKVVSSAYLKFLIFLSAILIPSCASFNPALRMIYSAYKLNKQVDNIQPWRIPFPIWNRFLVPCLVLTVASWLAYRLLRRQVRWAGVPISLRIFHSLSWSTQSKALVWSLRQK